MIHMLKVLVIYTPKVPRIRMDPTEVLVMRMNIRVRGLQRPNATPLHVQLPLNIARIEKSEYVKS